MGTPIAGGTNDPLSVEKTLYFENLVRFGTDQGVTVFHGGDDRNLVSALTGGAQNTPRNLPPIRDD